MRPFCLILGLVGFALADGVGHRHSGGQRQARRNGRQEAAPLGGYGASAPPLDNYGAASGVDSRGADPELAALAANIPGVPGEDYPIFAEVPESAFSCEGQVDGGYYADPEAQCQVFHICTADGQGGLSKYSFLCPNGTIFNQNYFICDWWFNFDCSEAEGLYSLNDDIAAERAAASGSEAQASYGAPSEVVEERLPAYEEAPPVPTYNAGAEAKQAQYANGGEAVVEARQARRQGRRQGGRRQQGRQGRRSQG